MTNFFNTINTKLNIDINFQNGLLHFGKKVDGNGYSVLIHPTMMETFGFESKIIFDYQYSLRSFDPSEMIPKVWEKRHLTN